MRRRGLPRAHPSEGTPGLLGSGPAALPRVGGAEREATAPGTSPGPDAVGGVAGRPRGRKDASRARPLSLPLRGALPLAWGGPERSEVGTQTQVKEKGLVAFPRSATPPPRPWLPPIQ